MTANQTAGHNLTNIFHGPGAKVHAARPTGTPYCNGRSSSGLIHTDAPVTCTSCIKRAQRNGFDPNRPLTDADRV